MCTESCRKGLKSPSARLGKNRHDLRALDQQYSISEEMLVELMLDARARLLGLDPTSSTASDEGGSPVFLDGGPARLGIGKNFMREAARLGKHAL